MFGFPAPDPIPLPAPVWLLKSLDIVTLALHFAGIQLLLGGLLVAWVLAFAKRRSPAGGAAGAMARRLPVVTTYVINLGVPPLLFAQVLYGRALYSSSVLMGAWWIAVIPLLTAVYWLLYRFTGRLEAGKSAWWAGALAWGLAAVIARIYVSNMTLMLRPEAWPGMYANSALGLRLPSGDPTILPRWLFALAGGLLFAGLWMLYLSGRRGLADDTKRFLSAWGGRLAALMAVVQMIGAHDVAGLYPQALNAWSGAAGPAWFAVLALIVVAGLGAGFSGGLARPAGFAAPGLAVLAAAALTLYRDGIRDAVLASKGLDVWAQPVVTNWGVVAIFLGVFVVGLGAVAWLISVAARAKDLMEAAQ